MEKGNEIKSLFTGGIGKKNEQGMSLWSVEGLKYFGMLKKMERGVHG
jgi:hypothetical protein